MVKHRTHDGRFSHGGRSETPVTTTTPKNSRTPTLGLKEVYSSTGTAKDATDFLVTKTALSRYVGIQSYRGAATALRVFKNTTPSVFNKPPRSTGIHFEDDFGLQKQEMLVLEYQLLISEYTKKNKEYLTYKREWEDKGPKLYNLILQHCPPVLILKITGQPGWKHYQDQQKMSSSCCKSSMI